MTFKRTLSLAFLVTLVTPLALAACSSSSASGPSESAKCESALTVQRFRSLAIVEDEVTLDARARNDVDGPWSFRRRMEDLAAPGEDPAALTLSWLDNWRSRERVNLFDVAARPFVEHKAFCNWLLATPSNGCDETCTTCTARKFDLARAPFRLLAITNRGDLNRTVAPPNAAGEVRFVYGLTQGAADDPASNPMFMSVIFEYRQPLKGRTRKQMAQTWYALGQHAALDEAFKSDLDKILVDLVGPGAEPDRPRGSSLSQVRVNEREFDWQWDMREYSVTEQGLTPAPQRNTPDHTNNGSQELASFLRDNRNAVLSGTHLVPTRLAGGSIGIIEKWSAPAADSDLVAAFSLETCNGCHQTKMQDFNLHITPFKSGTAKLSPFMNDPANPTQDDLGKREAYMRLQMCEPAP